MNEVRFFKPLTSESPALNITGITEYATDIYYSEKFYSYGSFEFTVPYTKMEHIDIGFNYIVLINREYAGIITGIDFTANSETISYKIYGYCLNVIPSWRQSLPPITDVSALAGFDSADGYSETVMKHFVNANMVNAVAQGRNIFGLEIAEDKERGVEEDKYLSRFELVSDILEKVGEASRLGHKISLDIANSKFIFDVIEGKNKTAGQIEHPPVIFSIENDNVIDFMRNNNLNNLKNVFYSTMSGAETEDEALTLTYYQDDSEEPVGIERREIHLNISATHPTPGEEYNELKRLALIEAENYRNIDTFEVDVTKDKLKYKLDYNLGDTVTLYDKRAKLQIDAQIVEVQIRKSYNEDNIKLIFGSPLLGLLKIIKRDINNK